MDRKPRPSKQEPNAAAAARWRKAADVLLVALGLMGIGLFVATRIMESGPGGRDGPAEREPAGSTSIGPDGGAAQGGSPFADLETGPDEIEGDPDPILGPAVFSDPGAARPFSLVDDPRLAGLLDPEIERALRVGRVPSMAVVCVAGDRIAWTRSAGLANIRVRTPASCDTVYLIASTFKTMSATALLQLMEQGKFGLDDRVNDHLTDFKIEHEYRHLPVTFRHLLTHTSGLPSEFGRRSVWDQTGPPALADYLDGRLKLWRRPGTRVMYSNLAFTLVAYLVEKFSGMPFKDYVRRNVFAPVEMRDTAFEPRADMAERLAIPYMPVRRRAGVYRPVDWVKADAWPAGVVYGTAVDLGRWLIANINGGVYKGRRIIGEGTFREMTRRQFDRFAGPINGGWLNETSGYGLAWWVSTVEGETVIAHSGSVNGYTAFIAGNIDRKTGVAILTNGNKAHRWLYALALKSLAALDGR